MEKMSLKEPNDKNLVPKFFSLREYLISKPMRNVFYVAMCRVIFLLAIQMCFENYKIK